MTNVTFVAGETLKAFSRRYVPKLCILTGTGRYNVVPVWSPVRPKSPRSVSSLAGQFQKRKWDDLDGAILTALVFGAGLAPLRFGPVFLLSLPRRLATTRSRFCPHQCL